MCSIFSISRGGRWGLVCLALWFTLGGKAFSQSSPLFPEGTYWYTPLRLSQGERKLAVSGLIDTGCSFCVVDSTFAVDSCRLSVAALTTSYTRAANGDRVKVHTCVLDRVDFCGTTFLGVKCLVVDLKGKFFAYAPNFIVGENLLSAQPLCFDLRNRRLSVGEREGEPAVVLHWQTRESRDGTFTKGIYLKGRVGNKKVRFFLDSGGRYNKVNLNLLPAEGREQMDLPRGNISRALRMQQVQVFRNVETKVGDWTTRLNFVLTDQSEAVLNFDFLLNTVFVLDYDRREIRIKR